MNSSEKKSTLKKRSDYYTEVDIASHKRQENPFV